MLITDFYSTNYSNTLLGDILQYFYFWNSNFADNASVLNIGK